MRKHLQEFYAAIERGRRFVTRDVWRIGLPGEDVPYGLIIKQVRAIILLIRGISDEMLLLRASALTFATLLFIVPFLAFMFYFIQAFNLGDQLYSKLEDQIDAQVGRLIDIVQRDGSGEDAAAANDRKVPPAEGEEKHNTAALRADPGTAAAPADANSGTNNARLQNDLISLMFPIFRDGYLDGDDAAMNPIRMLVERAEQGATNAQTITIAGLLFVLSTVFGFMRNIESSFNSIWGVKRSRNPLRALSDYMMITLLLPFGAATVLGITAALESEFILAKLGSFGFVVRSGQFAVICLTFTLLYWVVPNTRVKIRYALMGGIVAGALWTLTAWGYVKFQIGLANYRLFFSTFALFPLLLMWIYVSWVILLFGALLSFAYQNEKTFAMERLASDASHAYREALGVRLMVEMTRRFRGGEAALTVAETAQSWNVPSRLVLDMLDHLVEKRFVVACGTESLSYQPSRSTASILVRDIVRTVREDGRDPSLLREDQAYAELCKGLDGGDPQWLDTTLSEVADRLAPASTAPKGKAQRS